MSVGAIGLLLLLNLSPYGPSEVKPGLRWQYTGALALTMRVTEVMPGESGLDLKVELSSGGSTYALRAALAEDRRSLSLREEVASGGESKAYEIVLPELKPGSHLEVPGEASVRIEEVEPFSTSTPAGEFPEAVKILVALQGEPAAFSLLLGPGTGLLALEAEGERHLELSAFGAGEAAGPTAAAATTPELPARAGDLEVCEVRFDPVGEGKNSFAVRVRNLAEEQQAFTVHVYTRSRLQGETERGWGTAFSELLGPGEERWCSFGYLMWGAREASWVRLRFYKVPSPEALSAPGLFENEFFLEVRRTGSELDARAPELARPAPPGLADTILQRFAHLQALLREEKYEEAWRCFTRGHQQAGYQNRVEDFIQMMRRKLPAASWSRTEFTSLDPDGVEMTGELATVRARCGEEVWRVDFAEEDGRWQVDWVHGRPHPRLFGRGEWEKALLPMLERHSTTHFDIYYPADSAAERDLQEIARRRESGYQAVCNFLGVREDLRIRLIFFEEEESKAGWTGHHGKGWAFGTTIVEVYNDSVQLDPFHEVTHILAGSVGGPPAIFTEGLAVYMSELLGARALEDLGGGTLSVYERAKELKGQGEWIPLGELLTYTEIGSQASRAETAYPEAGAFVKFLVDSYGQERFLEVYGSLRNSREPGGQRENRRALERICGKPLAELNRDWLAAMGLAEYVKPSLSRPAGMQPFIAPADPPSAVYDIQARLDPEKKLLSGSERIHLVNRSRLTLATLALVADSGMLGDPLSEVSGSWDERSCSVRIDGQEVYVTPGDREAEGRAPLLVALAKPLAPGDAVDLEVEFQATPGPISQAMGGWYLIGWHPKLYWGRQSQDDYVVGLELPEGWGVAASGRLEEDGVWRAQGVRSFGIVASPEFEVMEAEAGDTQIRCLHRPAGKQTAEVLLKTAVDVVNYYRTEFGFYPQPSVSLVPGSSQSLGGFNVATGISAFHSMEEFGRQPLSAWQWITAHEIGHQYWGECVMDEDVPAWLWIGMGFYMDRAYTRARTGGSGHREYLDRYLDAVKKDLDTTMAQSVDQLPQLNFDFNGIVIHGKSYTFISALESVLGPEQFREVYGKCLESYRGKRLGAQEFERFCEVETGRNLGWFFDQWVRSNRVLAYRIASQESTQEGGRYVTRVEVERRGTLAMPVPVEARFADGSNQRAVTDRLRPRCELTFESASPLKEVVLDPEGTLPLLEDLPRVSPAIQEAMALPWTGAGAKAAEVYARAVEDEVEDAEAWVKIAFGLYDGGYYAEARDAFARLSAAEGDSFMEFIGVVWQGHVLDLLGRREEALAFYRKAKELPFPGEIRHDQYGIVLDEEWIEERLRVPFERGEPK